MNMKYLLSACLLSLVLVGCGGDDDDNGIMPTPTPTPAPAPEPLAYAVEVTNLTRGQPLSPMTVLLHSGGFQLFTVGEPASEPLELLAEAGDNSDLMAMAGDDAAVYTTASGAGLVMPGMSEMVMLEVAADTGMIDDMYLGLVTMLGNTNDGISAVRGRSLAGLAVGDSMTVHTVSYDAGTESNSETANTIIGPAAAGGIQEGFNPARDDIADEVRLHSGVVTRDDGLAASTLTQAHRWDNPVMQVTVTRMQ